MHVFYLLRDWGTGSVSCPGDVWAVAEWHQRQIHFCSAQLVLPQSGTPAAWLPNPADCTHREPWITSEFTWSRVSACVRAFDLLADVHSLEDTSHQQYVLACRCGRGVFSCKSPSQEIKKFAVNWNIYAKAPVFIPAVNYERKNNFSVESVRPQLWRLCGVNLWDPGFPFH